MNGKKGVLLVNLGSPKSTKVGDVRRYLREFLMDEKVIDLPFFSRFLLVNGIIAPLRAGKSAKAYRKIWWEEGSPLVVISERLRNKVAEKVALPVELAMRYSSPSLKEGLQKLKDQNVEEVLVIPLYPQYAMSTTETVVGKCEEINRSNFGIHLNFLPPFYNDKEYIECVASTLQPHLNEKVEAVLFSYHGIPERHIYKTDPTGTCAIGSCCFKENNPSHSTCYRHQCYATTEQVRKQLNLPASMVYQSFQSRLGKDPWLQPYTDTILKQLAEKGKKNILVLAPAFVADCLETLEEIAMEGKQEFLHYGGESFIYIPCLNDQKNWVDFITKKIHHFINTK